MARVFTDGGAMTIEAPANIRRFALDTFSVAFWLYRTATPAAERHVIGTWGGTTANGWVITLLATNLIQGYFTFTTQDKWRKSTTAPALNTWVHVVVTHEFRGLADTDFLFYFNGVQEAGTAAQTGIGTHSNAAALPLTVGNSSFFGALAPPANIGPVAIWNRAISPAEALALAGGAHPIRFREGLVESFDLDTAHGEEGPVNGTYLVQGATNPTSAAVHPPIESWPLLLRAA
jgi:hypothetical protein